MSAWSTFQRRICVFFLVIAGVTLAFMLVFTLTDVLMRPFGRPIVGDFEVISFLGAIVIGFSIPYTTFKKAHVSVDFLLEKLSRKASARMQICTRVVVIALSLWLSWNFVSISLDLIRTREVTPMYRVPYYPISFGLAFAFILQCLPLISEIGKLGGRHE